MNKVQILGTMTRDCELKYAQSGTAIGSFGIAYNEKRGDKEVSMFFDVTAFGKTAENIQKFFHKGSRILIDGSLDFQQWEKDGQKRSKVGIKLFSFDFIDKKEAQPIGSPANTPQQPAQNQQAVIPTIDIGSDDIPFMPMNWRLSC